MVIESNEYELLSDNMYYLKAKSLLCTIKSQFVNDIENTFVTIYPYELETVKSIIIGFLLEDEFVTGENS